MFSRNPGTKTNLLNQTMGAVGEDAFRSLCFKEGIPAERELGLDWDFNVYGMRIDVKIQRFNVIPRPDHNINLSAAQLSTNVDLLVFFYFNQKTNTVGFLGTMLTSDFIDQSTFKRQGEREPTGFTYACDTYVIAVKMLKSIDFLKEKGKIIAKNDIMMTSLSGKNADKRGEMTSLSRKMTSLSEANLL